MKAAYICAGSDVSFGRKGAGNYILLKQLAEECDYQIEIIDKVKVDGEDVSSTRVRSAVRDGRMEEAARLLGTPYRISGTVEHGRKLGSTLGMPTANLLPPQDKLLPPNGVYYSKVCLEGCEYRGISNVGYKPTVSDRRILGVETYLYDFDGDIYGQDMAVELLAFRRPEMKFDGVEALKEQMQKDIEAGRVWRG